MKSATRRCTTNKPAQKCRHARCPRNCQPRPPSCKARAKWAPTQEEIDEVAVEPQRRQAGPGASTALGVDMMGARAGSADPTGSGHTGVGAGTTGRARERRVRPGGARGQHLTAKPVADLPSLISSEPRSAGVRCGRGARERQRERVRERGREDCASTGTVRTETAFVQ